MMPGSTQGISRRAILQLAAVGGVAGLTAARSPDAAAAFGPAPANLTGGPVKTRATYYTPERVQAARVNVAELAWAGRIRDTAVAAAQDAIDAGAEWLWDSVTTQGLPRSFAVNQDLGSPITGTDIFEYGNYPWLADPYARPWKLEDPSSGYIFPTNDFAAFYASALDANGDFDRDLGDPQFLVNTAYPERGPDWGVDDGWGWVDDDGAKWTFCAYYNHWFLWYAPLPVGDHDMTSIRRGLEALRDAYLYTGDLTYAQHGIVLLDRFADAYPTMDTSVYTVADGYRNSDGGRGRGKAVGSIWENGLVGSLITAYDAFYPALSESDEAGVLELLSAKSEQYGLAPKETVADVRANIEHGVLRQIYPAVRSAQIFGNFGMHQNTLAQAAVVLDEPEAAKEWLDFVFAAGGLVNEGGGDWSVTGGNVAPTLVDSVDRDGWYQEGAPAYNILAINNLQNMADTLDGFDTYPVADVASHPKFEAMVAARPRLTMLSTYTPSIGNSGQTGKPLLMGTADRYVAAFERYGDPVDAQMAYLLGGNTSEGLRSDVFSPDAAGIEDRIGAVIDEHGPLDLGSEDLTGFGLAIHRTGSGGNERAMTTSYSSNHWHGYRTALALGMFGHGVDLMPGMGSPEFTSTNARRFEWESNTVAGNTVVVDGTPHASMQVGRPLGFFVGGGVNMSDVEAPGAYPEADTYRRTSVLVEIDDERYYILDVFRVRGGSEHVFSFHTAEGPATAAGVELIDQPTGSYAGPGIDPPDPGGEPRPGASGFDWLGNVQRGNPEGPFSIDWEIVDTYGVLDGEPDLHMRMRVLSDVEEVALADGIPPRNKPGNPESLRYALLRRTGETLDSRFTSVFEPFIGSSAISQVRTLPVSGDDTDGIAAVEVELIDGTRHWLVHDPDGSREVTVDDRVNVTGTFAIIRFDHEQNAVSMDGYGIQDIRDGSHPLLAGRHRRATLTGVVTERSDALEASATMEIQLDAPAGPVAEQDLVGRYVYVDDDGEPNAVFRIAAARSRGLHLELDVDTTFVREYIDAADPDAGYVYDVEPGRRVRIPAPVHWER